VHLSVQPLTSVTLEIEKDIPANVGCATYPDGIQLLQTRLVFDAANYNIPQKVEFVVTRNESIYQGVSAGYFHHFIDSDDPNYAAVFPRSLGLNLEDDDECVVGAHKYDDDGALTATGEETGLVRKCGCNTGYYISEVDPLHCNSVTRCTRCEEGMICSGATEVDDIALEVGQYRRFSGSLAVVSCPVEEACIGPAAKASFGDHLCREGHEGPFCMVCTSNDLVRYVWSDNRCSECDDSKKILMIVTLCLVGVGVCGAIVYIARKEKEREGGKGLHVRLMDCAEHTLNKYKIVVPYLQVLSVIVTLYPISLPSVFSGFVERIGAVVFLDMDLDCIFPSTFHDKLVTMTVAPFVFLAVVFLLFKGFQFHLNRQDEDVSNLQAKSISAAIIFLLTMYPIVSTIVIQTFVYDSRLDDGKSYLKADYAVEKMDDVHSFYVAYAYGMFFVYCLGMPLVFGICLQFNQKAIQELQLAEACINLLQQYDDDSRCLESEREKDVLSTAKLRGSGSNEDALRSMAIRLTDDNPMLGGLSPLYCDYTCDYWYFELPKMGATLVLCGLVTLISAEDASLVFAALVFSVGVLLCCAVCKPYMVQGDQRLAELCQFSLTFTLAVGLLEKAADSFPAAMFGILLVICTSVNLADGVGVIVKELLKAIFPDTMDDLAEKWDGIVPECLKSSGGSGNIKVFSHRTVAVAPSPDIVLDLSAAMPSADRGTELKAEIRRLNSVVADLNETIRTLTGKEPAKQPSAKQPSAKVPSVRKVDLNDDGDSDDDSDDEAPGPLPFARSLGVPQGSSSQEDRFPTVVNPKPRRVTKFQQVKSRVARVSLFNDIRSKAGAWNGF
jgi:hypothetical protein